MKSRFLFIIIILTACAFIAKGQEFPNLDLSDYCCTSNLFVAEPFTGPPPCCAAPWGVSHGSPQLVTNTSTIYICAGNGLCDPQTQSGQCGGSEGLLYGYTFEEGHKYNLKADLGVFITSPTLDRVRIALVNGLSPIGPGPGNSYNIPSWDDRQTVWTKADFGGSQSIDLTFVAEKEFTHLWLLADSDNEPVEIPPGSGSFVHNCFTITNLEISCCEEDKTISTTERVIYPGWTESVHNPLPPYTSVSGTVTLDLSQGDIKINEGEIVTITAGERIDILPSSNGELIEDTDNGAELHLIPEECLCSSEGNNICSKYVPAGTPPGQNVEGFEYVWLPSLFDPSGNNGEDVKNFIVQYAFYGGVYYMPYNAYKATFRIFAENGDMVHEQIFTDDSYMCTGIPEGSLFWNGCTTNLLGEWVPAAQAVYTYKLYLENCHDHTDPEIFGTVLLVESAAAEDCDGNFSPNDNTSLLFSPTDENSMEIVQLQRRPMEPTDLYVFPNPVTAENITLSYSSPIDDKMSLFIQDMNGKVVQVVEYNKFVKKGVLEMKIDASPLNKGIYILNFNTNHFSASRKIVKM